MCVCVCVCGVLCMVCVVYGVCCVWCVCCVCVLCMMCVMCVHMEERGYITQVFCSCNRWLEPIYLYKPQSSHTGTTLINRQTSLDTGLWILMDTTCELHHKREYPTDLLPHTLISIDKTTPEPKGHIAQPDYKTSMYAWR